MFALLLICRSSKRSSALELSEEGALGLPMCEKASTNLMHPHLLQAPERVV